MKCWSVWACIPLGMSLVIPVNSAQIYAEQKSESIYVSSVLIAASDLSLSRVEEESRRFMAATDGGGFKLRLLRITTKPEDARMMSGGLADLAVVETA